MNTGAAHKLINRFNREDVGASTAAAPVGDELASGNCLANRGGRLEAAVFRRLAGGQKPARWNDVGLDHRHGV